MVAAPPHDPRPPGLFVPRIPGRAAGTMRLRSRVVPITCWGDGLDHLVSDDAYAAGVAAGAGLYLALCGHQVAAQSPSPAPAGPPCPRCAVVHAHGRTGRARHDRHGRHRAPGGGAVSTRRWPQIATPCRERWYP